MSNTCADMQADTETDTKTGVHAAASQPQTATTAQPELEIAKACQLAQEQRIASRLPSASGMAKRNIRFTSYSSHFKLVPKR